VGVLENAVLLAAIERARSGAEEDAFAAARCILETALAAGASDVHLDPTPIGGVLGVRVIGVQAKGHIERMTLPESSTGPVTTALKALGGVDRNLSGRPQRGRNLVKLGDSTVDAQMSIFPSLYGDSLAIRMAELERSSVPLNEIFPDEIVAAYRAAVDRRMSAGGGYVGRLGVVICSGATGSGKSTVLHALLRDLMTPTERVMAVEDEVYIHIDGAVQGFTTDEFTVSDAMRSMEASDVDIALVGAVTTGAEMRQLFGLAKQGRLIFTTLHSADAAAALEELLAFGTLSAALVAESVRVITAQRLVRKSCETCRSTRLPTPEEAQLLGLRGAEPVPLATNAGCDRCGGAGTSGQVAAAEILTMTPALAATLLRGARDAASFRQALGAEYRTIADSIRVHLLGQTIAIETALEHLGREHELGAALDALVESVASDRPELGVPSLDGTVAIVFTDIVSSTARTAEVGDSVWMEALRHHQSLVRKEVDAWGGVEVKSTGDGFMLAFPSSMNAVRCAVAIRDSAPSVLARDGEPLGIKIGVHAGEPIRDGDDFYGTTVNVAARVAAAAGPGEVVVSELVRHLISTSKAFRLGPEREAEMKGIEGRQPIYPVVSVVDEQ